MSIYKEIEQVTKLLTEFKGKSRIQPSGSTLYLNKYINLKN